MRTASGPAIVPPRPAKRDILSVMVAGCVAFNNRENETS